MNFNNELLNSIVVIATGILGVATLAVILSRNANTVGVINAGGNAFSGGLATALSPITGTSGSNYGSNFGNGFGVSMMSPALSF